MLDTIRKYLKILGLKNLRDVLPEIGVLAHRSNARRMLDGTQTFGRPFAVKLLAYAAPRPTFLRAEDL